MGRAKISAVLARSSRVLIFMVFMVGGRGSVMRSRYNYMVFSMGLDLGALGLRWR